ncbi:hypothetical protein F2Q68_00012964 [Brassica cretica]|uniref:RBR-type E3 ubiquitin transferase n=1 Tax=Brassica cretica TaxID=69181 RepID=A0A8S9HN02_BRACR|nr:hypothetical protein F2Q68_00012964 [Brassica cretica]
MSFGTAVSSELLNGYLSVLWRVIFRHKLSYWSVSSRIRSNTGCEETCDRDSSSFGSVSQDSMLRTNELVMKWCPAPGCENAIEFTAGTSNYDVSCSCSRSFCWNCTEEAHRPVDCHTVAQWIRKNSAESENMNWILANSKPCPKCFALMHGQLTGKELVVFMPATGMSRLSKKDW